MARFWTRKVDDHSKEEETMQSEDFLKRVAQTRQVKAVEKPKIENTK